MDEFGVLVESMGFKSQRNSAPLANLKAKNSVNGFPGDLNLNSSSKPTYSSNPINDSFVDDLDGIFRSNKSAQNYSNYDNDDIFGGSFSSLKPQNDISTDLDSVFKAGNSGSYDSFDLLGTKPSQNDSIDDLFGNFGFKSDASKVNSEEKRSDFDDLIPGFGNPSNEGSKVETVSGNQMKKDRAQRVMQDKNKAFENGGDLEAFFSNMDAQQRPVRKYGSSTEDPVLDTLFHNGEKSKVEQTSSETSKATRKVAPPTATLDDFSLLFGDAVPSSGEFREIHGESEERRKARWNHHMRTRERMLKALDEKNQRDLQLQNEQEERRRIAESLDADIKRWAAGKEGNLRAMLSSLQQILWPECGWQPVGLTDLITSVAVKKVYYKATLFVHPDKVQQKGANLRQKFIAEKVFDLLKEAWNKFNAEELR